MIAFRRGARFLLLAALLAAGWPSAFADVRSNPYQDIPVRNIFNLKPPPPPQTETNQAPAVPPPKVILTGITSLFGPQVFLEITEQEPGKQPGMPKRPILRAGDREGDIEVLSIDIDHSVVKIRNGTAESELTFEVPKSGSSSGPAGAGANLAANHPGVNPPASPQGQPTIISSSQPRGGVTMLGGGGAFAGNSSGVTSFGGSTPMASGTAGGVSSFGGLPAAGGSAYNPALAAAGGFGTIPNRTMRTPQSETPQVDPATQQILMEANRMNYDQYNQNPKPSGGGSGRRPVEYPPLPNTELTPHVQGQPNQGQPGQPNPTFPPPFPGTVRR